MLRILHLGLGEIGKSTLRSLLAQAPTLKIVGLVDTHPSFTNQTLHHLLNLPKTTSAPNIKVSPNLAETLRRTRPDVATMTTGSRTIDVRETLETLIAAGVHVVSTCEELAFPTLRAPKLAAALDRKAKKAGVAILGTGVNPGFAMDAFALACTAPCTRVNSIRITRSLDAAKRRQQLQKKVGAGMTPAAVNALIRKNAIGHVGLGESAAMIAAGLGWKLDAIREKFTPVIAAAPTKSQFYTVQTGQVRGMRMTATGIVRGQPLIHLDLTMALAADTFDDIQIDGSPNLHIRTTTGFPGDPSTAGLLVNSARQAPHLPPGLRTMLDLLKIHSLGV